MTPEFEPFNKIPRLRRSIIVTEKIDGTNAQIYIDEQGNVFAGSRKRWITPGKSTDNFGFAAWVEKNREDLQTLGTGRHYGEWWGEGVQRGYGILGKRFSLFNVDRWADPDDRPECCHVVPELYRGPFDTRSIEDVLQGLRDYGSHAASGFMKPEGIVIFHAQSRHLFKVTLEDDAVPKSLAA